MLESFLSCLGCQRTVQKQSPSSTSIVETKYRDGDQPQAEIDAAAQDFVNVLIKAKTGDFNDVQLRKDLDNAVSTLSWSENLAAAILVCLETALRNGIKLGRTVEEATKKAMAAATEFATDHPVYFTLIALGVLALTVPWVLSWLGFAEIGIVEGSWAALWQARFAGYVPKGSLFSFFQRLVFGNASPVDKRLGFITTWG